MLKIRLVLSLLSVCFFLHDIQQVQCAPANNPSKKPVVKPGSVQLCPGHPDVDATLKTNTYSFPTTHPVVQPLLKSSPSFPGGIPQQKIFLIYIYVINFRISTLIKVIQLYNLG